MNEWMNEWMKMTQKEKKWLDKGIHLFPVGFRFERSRKDCPKSRSSYDMLKTTEETHDFSFSNFSLAKLKGLPKSLLPVCGKPLISHWIETADSLPEIDEIVVVTNNHFFKLFSEWKSNLRSDKKGWVFFFKLLNCLRTHFVVQGSHFLAGNYRLSCICIFICLLVTQYGLQVWIYK